ncbi:N-formylglutamate amidohydrolase [Sphingomonas sp. CCH18-H6]|uniref:N-formylglutamate amidohydrolase n=1 Tax=Sphingomonas sp. CCH18-H6 TaxID=1768787 RepID=UPI00082AEB8C|nr:N-formylglutamate amidohydrolase [Sphingomonas sp. CCH18-H6]
MMTFSEGDAPGGLLEPGEPPAVERVPGTSGQWLIVCDHASPCVPVRLSHLGLSESELSTHIGHDIGAAAVARRLAKRLSATLILSRYSRLVIDCNRYPSDPKAIPEVSDGIRVPGNCRPSNEEYGRRVDALFRPYHRAIASELDELMRTGGIPVFISVHSCTPSLDGQWRPWEIGFSWSADQRTCAPLISDLAKAGIVVGDNEPYSLDLGVDFTTPEHALRRGLPHIQVEFRQDLVRSQIGAEQWADVLADKILGRAGTPEWQTVQHPTGWQREVLERAPAEFRLDASHA